MGSIATQLPPRRIPHRDASWNHTPELRGYGFKLHRVGSSPPQVCVCVLEGQKERPDHVVLQQTCDCKPKPPSSSPCLDASSSRICCHTRHLFLLIPRGETCLPELTPLVFVRGRNKLWSQTNLDFNRPSAINYIHILVKIVPASKNNLLRLQDGDSHASFSELVQGLRTK